MNRFTCPCCGRRVFGEPPGSYDICPICFWQDDDLQLEDPTFAGGANDLSLIDAQRNYLRSGVSEDRFGANVRMSRSSTRRDPTWRPVEAERDRDPGLSASDPRDLSVLYYWRRSPST